jgi:hypothetical protein
VNPFVAVGIIIAAFFIAGLMVGFLIVMALSARGGGAGPSGTNPDDDVGDAVGDDDDPDDPPSVPWRRSTG